MPGGDGIQVDPDDLTRHAARLDRRADSLDTARQAGQHVRLGAEAYGRLCAIMPALLDGLQQTLVQGIGTAAGSVRDTADRAADRRRPLPCRRRSGRAVATADTAQGVTTNPLVATAAETPPSAWAGIWICEDIELIAQGVRNGSWIDGTLGVVSAGLDALAFVSDPVGALLQYGIAWLIEHVKPLSEALDWLAGDPAQITAHAQTWRNVAASLRKEAADLAAAVRTDVASWGGGAGPAYRAWAAEQQQAIGGLAQGADTLAAITEGAAGLVAAVRLLVRDAIATCVSRLIVYAGELVVTGGLAAPLVVEQVTTLVASWAARIARLLRGLLASLRRLMPEIRRLGDLIEKLKQALNRIAGIGPSDRMGRRRTGRTRRTDRSHRSDQQTRSCLRVIRCITQTIPR